MDETHGALRVVLTTGNADTRKRLRSLCTCSAREDMTEFRDLVSRSPIAIAQERHFMWTMTL